MEQQPAARDPNSGVMRTQPRGVGVELSAVAAALMIIMIVLSTDDRDKGQTRFIECEPTLVQAIATGHGVSTAQVRSSRGR
jgi:hypothetical protein